MKYRITTEVIRSGQPRAYADTEYVCRVTFEHTTYKDPHTFVPHFMMLEIAQQRMRYIDGYIEKKRSDPDVGWYETYLDYLKPIDPQTADRVIYGGDPSKIVASIWEFRTVSPYTD